jgi:Anti-sigma-K factor rskA
VSDLERIERMLREAAAPVDVPDALEGVARRAAVGDRPASARVARPRVSRWPFGRLLPAAAVMAAAAAATLLIGVGGRTPPFAVSSSLAMTGADGASATVDFGPAAGGTRPIMLRVRGLTPAPAGEYYEMWMRVGSDAVSVATFNTGPSGGATVRGSLAGGMSWRSCWVTLERVGGGHHTVLRAA